MQEKVLPFKVDPTPWQQVLAEIPDGFRLSPDGLFKVQDKGEQKISGAVWVTAKTCDYQQRSWGVVVHWIDHDGKGHEKAFPIALLHEQRGSSLVQGLAEAGLLIVPQKEKTLIQYLGSFETKARLQSVSRLGWLDGNHAAAVYVLPKRIIGIGQGKSIIFQPERHSPTTITIQTRGTLDEWKRNIAEPCSGNPLLIFSVCAAFAGTLIRFANLDSGGFHFYGNSSKGKTTALQCAASVWGCGADPAISESSHIRRWNATANALEGVAAAHNDGLLALDELGTCDAQDFGKVVYNLFGGQGKSRMSKDAMLQEQRSWRIFGLSTGEISSKQKIEEGSRRPAKAGQLVRLIDIPIQDKVILQTHNQKPDVFVNKLKNDCGRFYGTAGPEFIERLISLGDNSYLLCMIQQAMDLWANQFQKGKEISSVQQRALRRFALVAVAGKQAVEFGILPLDFEEVSEAIKTAWAAWYSDAGDLTDAERGVYAVRGFILKNAAARFRYVCDGEAIVRDLAGYIDANKGLYLFTDDGLREACAGYDYKEILKELERQGLLFKNETDRRASRHIVAGMGKRLSLYAVKTALLEK